MAASYRLAFTIEGVSFGLKEVEGLLRIDTEAKELIFEYQEKDSLVGVISSDVKSHSIPFSEIAEMSLKKGFLSSKVILQGTSMNSFEEIPGTSHAQLTLKVARSDRDRAKRIISYVNLAVSERNLRELE